MEAGKRKSRDFRLGCHIQSVLRLTGDDDSAQVSHLCGSWGVSASPSIPPSIPAHRVNSSHDPLCPLY